MRAAPVSRIVAEQNAFLRLLSDEALETLRPSLELIDLETDAGVGLPPRLADGFHFPIDGVLAVVRDARGGDGGFVRFVGRDSFVRIDVRSDFRDVLVVGSGRGLRAPGSAMWSIIERRPDWGGWAFEIGRLRNAVSMVNIACTASHSYRERVARLLVEARAAFPSARIVPFTHQQLSELIATRRETVSLVMGELARERMIAVGRGQIEILDAALLERAACRCCRETRAIEERTRALARDFFAPHP